MVSRPSRIIGRIEERHDALLLVVVQREPRHGKQQRNADEADEQHPLLEAVVQDHAAKNSQHGQGRPEVRLAYDESRRDTAHARDLKKLLPRQRLAVQREHLRPHEQHGDLGHFTGLEVEESQIDPAARAVDDFPKERDQAEGKEHNQKKRECHSLQMAVIEAHAGDHGDQAERPPDHLALIVRGKADAVLHPDAAGGIQVADAHPEQQERGGHKPPVDIRQQSPIYRHVATPDGAPPRTPAGRRPAPAGRRAAPRTPAQTEPPEYVSSILIGRLTR